MKGVLRLGGGLGVGTLPAGHNPQDLKGAGFEAPRNALGPRLGKRSREIDPN
jgi:hypothetical protein